MLGYRDRDDGGEDLIDPRGRGPLIWFQEMDAPRSQRNRIHVDIWVRTIEPRSAWPRRSRPAAAW